MKIGDTCHDIKGTSKFERNWTDLAPCTDYCLLLLVKGGQDLNQLDQLHSVQSIACMKRNYVEVFNQIEKEVSPENY